MTSITMHRHIYITLTVLALTTCVHGGNKFEAEALRIANALRNIHGAPGLKLDEKLKEKATKIAVKASKDGRFTEENGVNTFMLCTTLGRRITAKETIEAWYDEVCSKGFSFDKPNNKDARALTELIWKDVSTVGFGKATQKYGEKGTCTFVAAAFRPPGNVEVQGKKNEQFLENVKKGRFNSSYCNKFDTDKREKITRAKRIVEDGNHELDRRSLYYRFPAKFLIDPITGQTKAISPEATTNPFTKSQLATVPAQFAVNPYEPHQYPYSAFAAPQQQQTIPYVANENSFYHQETMQQPFLIPSSLNMLSHQNPVLSGEMRMSGFDNLNVAPAISTKFKVARKNHANAKKRAEGGEQNTLRDDALKMHNELRKVHGVPDLQIDDKLCKDSEEWAQKIASNGKLEHSAADGYGENLAYRCSGDKSVSNVKDSIKDWYAEVCTTNYEFNSDKFQGGALHFTQVVWKTSDKLGIGMATAEKDGMLCTYFVGRYTKKGNMVGEFKENVPKGTFKKSMCDDISKDGWEPSSEKAAAPATAAGPEGNSNDKPETSPESQPETSPDTKPETSPGSQPEKSPETKPETSPDTKPETSPGSQPEKSPETKPETSPGSQPETSPENQPDTSPETQPDTSPGSKPEKSPQTQPDMSPGTQPETSPGTQPETSPETQPETSPGTEPETSPETQPEKSPETKPETSPGTKPETSPQTQPDMSPGTQPETSPGTEPETSPGTEPETSPETKPETSPETKPETSPENKPETSPGETKKPKKQTGGAPSAEKVKNPENEDKEEDPVAQDNSGKTQQQMKEEQQQEEDEKNYQEDALKVINKFREIHSAPPLIAESSLHIKAKSRADNFVTGLVKRTERKQQVGENVQVACNPIEKVLPPEEAIANWYREACSKSYSFEKDASQNASHFTQLIWIASKEIGIAYSTKKKRNGHLCTVIVAEFNPAGNTLGGYLTNVNKGTFDRSFCGSINTVATAALDEKPRGATEGDIPDVKGSEAGEKPISTDKSNPSNEAQSTKVGETPIEPEKQPTEENSNNGEDMKENPGVEGNDNPSPVSPTAPPNIPSKDLSTDSSKDPSKSPSKDPSVNGGDDDDDDDDNENINNKESPSPESSPKPTEGPTLDSLPVTTTTAAPSLSEGEKALEVAANGSNNEAEKTFIKEVVLSHNALRSIHGVPPLLENEELSIKAKEMSEGFTSNGDSEKRSANIDFGENVEQQCFDEEGKELNADDAVLQWWSKGYCDNKDLFANKENKVLSPGTQVTWKASTEIGVGKTNFKNKEGKSCSVVVALYSPKGNVEGEFDENVIKGDFDFTTMCSDIKNTLTVAKEMMANNESTADAPKPAPEKSPGETQKPQKPEANQKLKPEEGEELNQEAFVKDALKAHNTLRAIHNAPPMVLDDELNKGALEYAKQLAVLGKLKHASKEERKGAGENLAFSCSSSVKDYPGSNPVGAWYGEVCKQRFSRRRLFKSTGHFTQVIWKSSLKLGIGVAMKQEKQQTCYYIVARYDAPGNVLEEYRQNVKKGRFRRRNVCYHGEVKNDILYAARNPRNNGAQTIVGESLINASVPRLSLKRSKVKLDSSHLPLKGILKKVGDEQRYSEVCNPGYDFGNGKFDGGTGHFTQVVWKDSIKLGMGFATGKQGSMTCYYAVGRYSVAGNMAGEFSNNVLKGSFTPISICNGDAVKEEVLNAGVSSKRHVISSDVVSSVGPSLFNGDQMIKKSAKIQRFFKKQHKDRKTNVKGVLKKTYIPVGEQKRLHIMRKAHHRY